MPKINVNNIVLVYNEKVLIHFLRIAIVRAVLPSSDSDMRGTVVRIAKTNTILKRPVNEPFAKTVTKQITQGNKSEGKK